MPVRRRPVALLLVLVALLIGVAAWLAATDAGDRGEGPTRPATPSRATPRVTSVAPPSTPRRPRARSPVSRRDSDGHLDAESLRAALGSPSEDRPLRFRVLADEDDSPLAGAVVRGARLGQRDPGSIGEGWRRWAEERGARGERPDPARLATTDADGRCSLTAPEGWPVEIVAEGRWPQELWTDSAAPGETVVWLPRTGRVRGQVREADGAPVPGALVTLSEPGADAASLRVAPNRRPQVADAEGRFSFDVRCGEAHRIAAVRAPTDAPPVEWFVRVPARRPEIERDLILPRKARVVLDVIRPEGTPAAGAAVEILDGALGRAAAQGRADGGRFEQDVGPGSFLVNAVLDATPVEFTEPAGLLVPGGARVERTLRLVPSVAVTGRVVDAEGRGIAGVRVEWCTAPGTRRIPNLSDGTWNEDTLAPVPRTLVSEADGRFSLGGLRTGLHVGRLIAPGALPRRVEVTAPADDLRVVVAAAARLRWTVATEGAETPPDEVRFRWVPAGDERFALTTEVPRTDGAFAASVPPGRGRLRVEESGGGLLLERDLDLAPGGVSDLGAVPLPRWRTIRGRVGRRIDALLELDVAMAKPSFFLPGESRYPLATFRTDGTRGKSRVVEVGEDGSFRLEAREAEGERVRVSLADGSVAVSEVLPTRGDVDLGALTARPCGRLRGLALREAGSVPAGGGVTWRAVPDTQFDDRPVDVDGGFVATLPAGRVRILLRSEFFGSCDAEVEILPGRTTDATFRLRR